MMNRRTPVLLMAVLFAVGLFGAFVVVPAEVEIGKAVPEFSLQGIDGKKHSLSEYKGRIVVLEWTNPNCPFVQRVYREGIMQSVQKKYAYKVIWMTVNSTNPVHEDHESVEDLSRIYKEWKATFATMLLDPDGKVGKMFDARTTPHMFIINREGKLVYAGGIDDDPRGGKPEKTNYVDDALISLLEGKPIAVSSTRSYGCSVKY